MTQKIAGLENLMFQSSSSYSVTDEVGRGGMGIINLAHKDTGGVIDQVVLKSLRTILPEEEEKLRQEASIATMLRHENIVKTYGLELVPASKLPPEYKKVLGEENQGKSKEPSFLGGLLAGKKKPKKEEKHLLLLVMDYVKGTDFHTLLVNHLQQDMLFPIPLAAFVISRIASALSYAHTYIIHRDISPENILISEQGVCKLTDFGVAVVSHQQPEDWAGKLMYMAPEQIRNENIDERADIFALGLCAYQAVTGIPLLHARPTLPFEDQIRMIYNQLENDLIPPHLVCKDVPIELSRIIAKMLASAPEYRYQRAAIVSNDLEKEFLYAKGYGPTNNSLAAYIDIFNSNFHEYDEEQLQQLTFLKDKHGNINLRRPLRVESYTRKGQRLLAERKGALIVKRLRAVYKQHKEQTIGFQRLDKIPVIKVKYLGNVIETFSLMQNVITAGRNARNSIILPNKVVSNLHASFYMSEGVATVEDENSQNGTYVNNVKIKRGGLKEGDKIQIGTTMLYFLWDKKPAFSDNIIVLNGDIDPEQLSANELTLEFLPNGGNFVKLHRVVEEVLVQTNLGGIKRNVIPAAVYEAVQIFSGENHEKPMKVKIMRSRRYLGFYCTTPEKSYGYEAFLASVSQRMEKELGKAEQFEAEEIAMSLILKAFDRIEMYRDTKEIALFHFFV